MEISTADIFSFFQNVGIFLDFIGVFVILAGTIISILLLGYNFVILRDAKHQYREFRQHLGRSILIGLEFLVAGDIISSVTGKPSVNGVIILGIIILIRSFLSIQFELEVEGRWPWDRSRRDRDKL